jgi:hypothetical protein
VHAPAESGIVHESVGRDELQFAFIDADHRHPRPLLDLVRMTPCIRSGGILLHDIKLGSLSLAAKERGETPHGQRLVQSGSLPVFLSAKSPAEI